MFNTAKILAQIFWTSNYATTINFAQKLSRLNFAPNMKFLEFGNHNFRPKLNHWAAWLDCDQVNLFQFFLLWVTRYSGDPNNRPLNNRNIWIAVHCFDAW